MNDRYYAVPLSAKRPTMTPQKKHLLALLAFLGLAGCASIDDTPQSRIDAALENVETINRPHKDGYATIWEDNFYVQCSPKPGTAFRCEAAGARLQPSLDHILTPERIARLNALGWDLDPSFGNYVKTFPPKTSRADVSAAILQALMEGYDANPNSLETGSDWIDQAACPPRNGYSQNLAGLVNDDPSMASAAIHSCSYTPPLDLQTEIASTTANAPGNDKEIEKRLLKIYERRIADEIQRLRINKERSPFIVMTMRDGYFQCMPDRIDTPPVFYCEAQSIDSWGGLAAILTPERIGRLHDAGYADPGRTQNYWKNYPMDRYDNRAIAGEIITLMHEAYGYEGLPPLSFSTEKDK